MNRFANISASGSGTFGKFYQKFVKFFTHNQIFNFGKIPMLKVMKQLGAEPEICVGWGAVTGVWKRSHKRSKICTFLAKIT